MGAIDILIKNGYKPYKICAVKVNNFYKPSLDLRKDDCVESVVLQQGTTEYTSEAPAIRAGQVLFNVYMDKYYSETINFKMKNVTRFEVIDESGRSYQKHNTNVRLDFQDRGQTLKVFIED